MLTKCDMTTTIINFATFSADGKKVLLVKNKDYQWGVPAVSNCAQMNLYSAIDKVSKEIENLVGLPQVEQVVDLDGEKFFKLRAQTDAVSMHGCALWLDARFATLEEAFYILAGESEKTVAVLKKLSKTAVKN